MNRGTKKYKKDTSNAHDLDGTNYDNSEYIFSWEKDTPEIKTDVYRCSNCNYIMESEAAECGKCGFPISVYGYRELEYDYMDADGNEIMYETDDATVPCDYTGTDVDAEFNEETPRKVRFDDRPKIIGYNYSDSMNYDDQTSDDVLEHMNDGTGVYAYVIGHLCIMLIAFLVAYWRGELYTELGGQTNWHLSMIACIILFPNLYLIYALVEFITRWADGI